MLAKRQIRAVLRKKKIGHLDISWGLGLYLCSSMNWNCLESNFLFIL